MTDWMEDTAELVPLLSGARIGLVFTVEHFGAGPGGVRMLDETTRYFVNLHLSGVRLSRFESVGVHQRRRTRETTEWREGWSGTQVTAPPGYVARADALPTAATPDAVLEDILGPLREPLAKGWRPVAVNRYERQEEIGRLRLSVGRSLAGRVLETIDDRSGHVLDRLTGFVAGPQPVRAPERIRGYGASTDRGPAELRPPDGHLPGGPDPG